MRGTAERRRLRVDCQGILQSRRAMCFLSSAFNYLKSISMGIVVVFQLALKSASDKYIMPLCQDVQLGLP